MRDYEIVYIFDSTLEEEEIESKLDSYHERITDDGSGEVTAVEDWGKRQLAYPIEDNENGHYVVAHFTIQPEALEEFERRLNLDGDLLRHLVVLHEGELPVPPSARRPGAGPEEGEEPEESEESEESDESEESEEEPGEESADEDESGSPEAGESDEEPEAEPAEDEESDEPDEGEEQEDAPAEAEDDEADEEDSSGEDEPSGSEDGGEDSDAGTGDEGSDDEDEEKE